MPNSISIIFGEPSHGWLPVKFIHKEFKLDLDASDVLNDPVAELYDAVMNINYGRQSKITWWLEPYTYFFRLQFNEKEYTLTITEARDIDGKEEDTYKCSGNYNEIIKPCINAILALYSRPIKKDHWPYNLSKQKLKKLEDLIFNDWTKNKIAVELFDKLANHYQNRFMNVDHYGDTLDIFCNDIKVKDAEILELACGPGNVTKYLLAKRKDFKLFGTDLAPNMVELARVNNPNAQFEIMDCRHVHTLQQKFDGIMCAFCFPYLSKEEAVKLINDAALLLKSGGLIYISTMEDDYAKSGPQASSTGDVMYMHYHEGSYLSNAIESAGLKIHELKRQPYPPTGEKSATDLIIIAKKNG